MGIRVPQFNLPQDAAQWENQRAGIMQTVSDVLGELPPAVAPEVETISVTQLNGYKCEHFRFHNGDPAGDEAAMVYGVLLIPDKIDGFAPTIQYYHSHGRMDVGKDELWTVNTRGVRIADELISQGYIVCAIDSYAFGERRGKGPGGPHDGDEEASFAKRDLLYGRTLWGMHLRDETLALDYLVTRPEVDRRRIAAFGMSMGGTKVWWRMALDSRLRMGVVVSCLTRYEDLVQSQGLGFHGIYYYVPGVLQHFDTEAIVALAAPRPLLCLTGDHDVGSPVSGVEKINRDVSCIYEILRCKDRFESVVYSNVGHEWTAEMWDKTMDWLGKWFGASRSELNSQSDDRAVA